MSSHMDLAQRLDACWLDIIAPDTAASAATLARCANLIQEAAAALRSRGIPGDPAFECMAYDAHCPSGTVRFQAPKDFPLAGGIFRIQRIRSATPEDIARFAHLPDAPEYQYD